jgi:hypothetical protein
VLGESQARQFEHVGIGYKCSSGLHRHYTRSKADALVAMGEAEWVGIGKNILRYVQAKTWANVHRIVSRVPGAPGEASQQMIPGGAVL